MHEDLRRYIFQSEDLNGAREINIHSSKRFVEHPMVKENAIEDRLYQREIVESCLERNTLVVLPTALGKTIIAELLAAELLYRYPGSRVMVLAPTKPLVSQHMSSFLNHLKLKDYEVATITGETTDREYLWRDRRIKIFFATPQTVWNDILNGYVRLEEFSLVVFDECHRSRSRYAYTRIADEYVKRCPWPLILALTASPGSDEERVMEVCNNLMIENIVWRTESDVDIVDYIPGSSINWIRVDLPEDYKRIRNHIRSMIENIAMDLYRKGFVDLHPDNLSRRSLVQLMSRVKDEVELKMGNEGFQLMTSCSMLLSLFHALELIESQHIYSLRSYLEEIKSSTLRSHKILSKMPEFERLMDMVKDCKTEHTKLDKLLSLIREHLRRKGDDRIIVFANIRHTAEAIVRYLRSNGIMAELFVGRAEGKSGPRMSQEEQKRILNDFRAGRVKVLVATSIGEEGLDIPECGYVIFYEPTASGIRYIQRKGRTGRRFPGNITILISKGTVDEYYFKEGYRRASKMVKVLKEVVRKLSNRHIERIGPKPEIGKPWPWSFNKLEEQRDSRELNTDRSVKEVEEDRSSILKIAQKVYTLILNAGLQGIDEQHLAKMLDEKAYLLKPAINYLRKRGLIVEVSSRLVSKANLRSMLTNQRGDIFKIEIEKVYPGFAIVIVNDSFRARLDTSSYYGPKDYIKKGRILKVWASIVKVEGVTNIIVHDVIGVIA